MEKRQSGVSYLSVLMPKIAVKIQVKAGLAVTGLFPVHSTHNILCAATLPCCLF